MRTNQTCPFWQGHSLAVVPNESETDEINYRRKPLATLLDIRRFGSYEKWTPGGIQAFDWQFQLIGPSEMDIRD